MAEGMAAGLFAFFLMTVLYTITGTAAFFLIGQRIKNLIQERGEPKNLWVQIICILGITLFICALIPSIAFFFALS